MEFEWDEAKAKFNLRKHGVDFADAAHIFEDSGASHVLDETMDYGEDRFKAIGMIDGVILVVIYAETRRMRSNHICQKGNET